MIVGNAQGREKRFPVYHDLLTTRSNFLLAVRTAQPQQPVRLDDEDPEVFSLYLNCVHSGIEVVRSGGELLSKQVHTVSEGTGNLVKRERDSEQGVDESDDHPDGGRFEALIKLYLLAGKLHDFKMMNSATDELVRMVNEDGLVPAQVNLVYSSTRRGDPLRILIRDVYIHEAESPECHEFLQTNELHLDLWRDISLEYFKLKDTERSVEEVYGLKIGKDKGVNRCDYHQKQTDDEVEVVPPPTASAAAAGVTAHRHAPTALQTSSQSGRPSNTASLVSSEQRAPPVPQSSARRSSTAVAAVGSPEQHNLAAPHARSGRRPGTGAFVFRRSVYHYNMPNRSTN